MHHSRRQGIDKYRTILRVLGFQNSPGRCRKLVGAGATEAQGISRGKQTRDNVLADPVVTIDALRTGPFARDSVDVPFPEYTTELDLFLYLGMVEVSSRLPIRKGPTMADKSAVKSSKQSARALKERRAEKREKALESTQLVRKRKS